MNKVLIDTDVLLDFFFDRQPFSKYSSEILNKCADGEYQGYVTAVIISNVYYLLRKTAKHEYVVEKLKQLLQIVEIIPTEHASVVKALNSPFKDFEDALQNYSAESATDIKVILTRNLKDFKKSELAILTPETYLKTQ